VRSGARLEQKPVTRNTGGAWRRDRSCQATATKTVALGAAFAWR